MRFFTFENVDWSDAPTNFFFFGSAGLLTFLFLYILSDKIRQCNQEQGLLEDITDNQDEISRKGDEKDHKISSSDSIQESNSNYSEL